MRVQDFVNFVLIRDDIRRRKESGGRKPWTQNKILQQYRFCNVRREDDKVTKWITENWRIPLSKNGDPNLWFWMLVARLVNHPDTLAPLTMAALSSKWNASQFVTVIENRQAVGDKAWGGAYIVSTNGNQMPKAQYIAEYVLAPAWERRKALQPRQHCTLHGFCHELLTLNGVQGFIAGQVIADAKYGDEFLAEASDWHTFAVSGPGSRRGLNRVVGRDKDASWKENEWLKTLSELRALANYHLGPNIGALHAQDIQNCLCEFDKYERVRLGEGRPRATYPGLR